MDNMLYIIAAVVLILLVVALVLRKKKAQQPSVQAPVKSGKNAVTPAAVTKPDYGTPTQSNNNLENKFDHITIAQRFIDQQRFDKAIETLERGLSEKPNNSQLSLKLLSIYATIDQPENFNNVYNDIKTQNDPQTIAQANELKALFFEEQAPVALQEMPVEDHTNFESIDFDLPTSQVNDKNTLSDQPIAESNTNALVEDSVDNLTFSNDFAETDSTAKNVEEDFDLTMSDFENDFDEPATTETPATSLNITDHKNLDTSPTDGMATTEDNEIIDFDFDFDFDSPEQSDSPTDISVSSDTSDSAVKELSLDNEEFILDFDDLATDFDKESEETIAEALTLNTTQSNEDDFTLSLDSLDESNTIETMVESKNPTFEENSHINDFVLEDSSLEDGSFEDGSFENINLENSNFEDLNLEEKPFDDKDVENTLIEKPSAAKTAPLLFDDNTVLEEGFDFEADTSMVPTSVAPVEAERSINSESKTESADDFSSRFSADFDFVKSLDSNQVTLDLASQYIKLGEYDSAKRLLNEVMNQGNNEQQNKAKALLERTA
ncbi:FimV/HubP family polar landmark protein [Psychrobacter immobilis]|uniref:FimV/HubP family polar landmark protein n=1 Tax=Psychrobacter immobilis TaxID=498 RepID=UPI00191B82FE|nr:FimV/HubP family polar landmark protein [Psychrobacter immobilis]